MYRPVKELLEQSARELHDLCGEDGAVIAGAIAAWYPRLFYEDKVQRDEQLKQRLKEVFGDQPGWHLLRHAHAIQQDGLTVFEAQQIDALVYKPWQQIVEELLHEVTWSPEETDPAPQQPGRGTIRADAVLRRLRKSCPRAADGVTVEQMEAFLNSLPT